MERRNLAGKSIPQIEACLAPLGLKPFRARQLFRWIYRRACMDFAAMTDIALPVRETLARTFTIDFPSVVREQVDASGTRKIALALADGHVIESVLIPDRRHDTICLSSQVGCAMGCAFCLSGARGLKRNLAPHEIIGQFLALRARQAIERPTNVVLMGIGEPCHNLENVLSALSILKEELGASISMHRTTFSTSGIIPAIGALMERPMRPRLAVSLNAATDAVRTRIMPINRRYPLRELLALLRTVPLKRGEKITFEYVLIKDVNDAPTQARRLVSILKGIPSKINLIPLNPVPGKPYQTPAPETIERFEEILRSAGYTVVRRRSMGQAISAACGQLAAQDAGPGWSSCS